MIEFIKRCFCKHGEMKIIEEYEYINLGDTFYDEWINNLRKYLICEKCGYKRKISKK
jgi:hypothetical protein